MKPRSIYGSAKAIVPLTAALVLIVAMGIGGGWAALRVAEAFRWVDHTHRVLYELEATLAHAVSVQSGTRGFSLTGEERYLAPYDAGLLGMQHSIARLKTLTVDNAQQQARLQRLSMLVNEEVAIMQQRLEARRRGGIVGAVTAAADGRGKQVVEAIRRLVASMQEEERRLLNERSQFTRAMGWTALAVFAVGSAGALAGILVAIARLRSAEHSHQI